MAEITVQLKIRSWHIGTIADKFDEWADLVQWCLDNHGMYCSMAPQVDSANGIEIQVGGREYGTVYPTLDSYVVFNGFTFEALATEQYQEKYGNP